MRIGRVVALLCFGFLVSCSSDPIEEEFEDTAGRTCTVVGTEENATCDAEPIPTTPCVASDEPCFVKIIDDEGVKNCVACCNKKTKESDGLIQECALLICSFADDCLEVGAVCQDGLCKR